MTRVSLAALAFACLAGCTFEKQPLQAGETFRIEMTVRGTTERFIALDVQPDFGSPTGGTVALSDRTTTDDSLNATKRIRIEGLRPGDPHAKQRGLPTRGRYEWRELTARGNVRLVLEYKGHDDTYHLTFPPEGGARVEPSSPEFSRIFVTR